VTVALTREFRETVTARVQRDPALAKAMLDEAITLFLNGEPASARLIVRDVVNATIGFQTLAEELHKPAKSLHRMLSRSGNLGGDVIRVRRSLCAVKLSGRGYGQRSP
jgi:hypothetical protein